MKYENGNSEKYSKGAKMAASRGGAKSYDESGETKAYQHLAENCGESG